MTRQENKTTTNVVMKMGIQNIQNQLKHKDSFSLEFKKLTKQIVFRF